MTLSAKAGEALSSKSVLSFFGRRREATIVFVGFLTVWELLAVTIFKGRFVVPAPSSVLATAWGDGFYVSNLMRTLSEASLGWLIGNGVAILLAALCLVFPRLEAALLSLGVMTYAVPTVAIGPILFIIQDPFSAKVTMSALSVFFVTLIAAVAGLRSASKTSLELTSVFGGGKWDMLRRVRIRASIPALTTGLCISAPAAILGAVIGDYFGGQNGLGVIMLQAQEQLSVSRTWAIALVTTVVSGLAYAATAGVAKIFGAWTSVDTDNQSGVTENQGSNSGSRPLAFLGKLTLQIVIALGVWYGVVAASGLGGYFLKTPQAVWAYLFIGPQASSDLTVVLSSLGTTLFHAGVGWVVGSVLAIFGAILMSSSSTITKAVMPMVLIARSVPLVAMTPLIALMLGRGLVGITAISALVTLVPTLVTIVDGLKKLPIAALNVVSCSGGSNFDALIRVRLFYGLPAVFTAAKISMPGAILGAVLAEWLVAGSGIGHIMAYDVVGSNFSNLWASIVAIVIVSLTLYSAVSAAEGLFRKRFAI